jgi:hypothetical protein
VETGAAIQWGLDFPKHVINLPHAPFSRRNRTEDRRSVLGRGAWHAKTPFFSKLTRSLQGILPVNWTVSLWCCGRGAGRAPAFMPGLRRRKSILADGRIDSL